MFLGKPCRYPSRGQYRFQNGCLMPDARCQMPTSTFMPDATGSNSSIGHCKENGPGPFHKMILVFDDQHNLWTNVFVSVSVCSSQDAKVT
jgi:hypothetical protein